MMHSRRSACRRQAPTNPTVNRFMNIVKKHQVREQKLTHKMQENMKLFHADLVDFVKAEVEEAKKMMKLGEDEAVVTPEVMDMDDDDSGVPADAPMA